MNKADTNALKGLAILFVLLGHLNYLDSSDIWGVHIFLILSGFGLEVSFQHNGLANYWRKRFFKVFVPYEIIILFALLVEQITILHLNAINIITSILGFDLGYNIDHSMWYISYLFLLYCEFYVWKKYSTGKPTRIGFPALFVIFNFILSVCDKIMPFAIWSPSAQAWIYSLDFFAGILAAQAPIVKCKRLYSCLMVVVILYFVMRYGHTHFKVDIVLFTLSAAIASIMLGLQFKIGRIEFLQKLGDISFFIYLIEGHLLRWKDYFLQWINNENLRKIIIFCLCLLLGVLFQRMVTILHSKSRNLDMGQ